MCGIVGLVNGHPVARDLINGLERLEYRGYDSAGLAVAGPGFTVRKTLGRAAGLLSGADVSDMGGHAGIAHTRWATHGRAEARNAHPHVFDGVAVVHNGIVENHHALRTALVANGHSFESDTDSEVIPHLIAAARAEGASPTAAVRIACEQLEGAYAIAVLFEDAPDRILVARQGSPVVVARGDAAAAVASDAAALNALCNEFAALENGDIAELSHGTVAILDAAGNPVDRIWQAMRAVQHELETVAFSTDTRREIASQSAALARTDAALRDRAIPADIVAAERLVVVACGSSLYAAAIARGWIERLAGVPCDLEVASEYRTRNAPLVRGTVGVLVSQSGETADTLGAMELLRSRKVPVVAVVNVPGSPMARGADLRWLTSAGTERGVAATKSFTCQVLALVRLGLAIGLRRGVVAAEAAAILESEIAALGQVCAEAECQEERFGSIAGRLARESEAMFIGRGWGAAIAAEGALKLKELSYIRADSYPAGELKHGPIALIREGSPVIICASADQSPSKTLSSAEEVRARGAYVIALVDQACAAAFETVADEMVVLPGTGLSQVFAQAVGMQLIACHAAMALGRDVDRPRNLAKSVTVE